MVEEDDGTFWISFEDYTTFFYITTICFYKEEFEDNTVADMHEIQGYGLCKFKLDRDVTTPITFSFDQVNARFVDETMQGAYEYPSIKFVLTQIVEG